MNDHAHADTLPGADASGAAVSATPPAPPVLSVGAQYLRRLSIDVPNTPEIFQDIPARPHVGLVVDVTARQIGEGPANFEVSLVIRAQGLDAAPTPDAPSPRVLYEANIAYAGLFGLSGLIARADLEPMLLVEAPAFLFPAARTVLLDAVREAGFPVANIQPIDFRKLWESRRNAQG